MLRGNEIPVVDDEAHAVVFARDLLLVNVSRGGTADLPRSVDTAFVLKLALENQDEFVARMAMSGGRRAGSAPHENLAHATRGVVFERVPFEARAEILPSVR